MICNCCGSVEPELLLAADKMMDNEKNLPMSGGFKAAQRNEIGLGDVNGVGHIGGSRGGCLCTLERLVRRLTYK